MKQWIINKCVERMISPRNVPCWFTRSHPSKGENRNLNREKIASVHKHLNVTQVLLGQSYPMMTISQTLVRTTHGGHRKKRPLVGTQMMKGKPKKRIKNLKEEVSSLMYY